MPLCALISISSEGSLFEDISLIVVLLCAHVDTPVSLKGGLKETIECKEVSLFSAALCCPL